MILQATEKLAKRSLFASLFAALLLSGGCANDGDVGVLGFFGPPKYNGMPGAKPAETLKYINGLKFNTDGEIANYPHECKTGCPSGGGTAQITVRPQERARKVNWFNALKKDKPGYVVAVVTNHSPDTIPEFGLAPGGQMYEWIGEVDANGARGHAFIRLNPDGSVAQWIGLIQKVKVCEDEAGKSKSAVKRNPQHSKGCKYPTGEGKVPIERLEPNVPSQTWISCKTGCCQADPTK